jgi:hypothetical protein
MQTYKSIASALNAIKISKADLKELGTLLIAHYRKRIESNETDGVALAAKTIKKKEYRGAKSPSTKLLEGGGMARQIKQIVTSSRLEVGLLDEPHKKFKKGDTNIQVNDLARIHHEGTDTIPSRKFLVLEDEESKIVSDWLSSVLRRKFG